MSEIAVILGKICCIAIAVLIGYKLYQRDQVVEYKIPEE